MTLSVIAGRLSGPGLLACALALSAVAPVAAAELATQLTQGEAIFAEHCAHCHGAAGEGGPGYPNSIVSARSLAKFRTAKGLYDYNRMMMPFDDPARLTAREKWEVTAYLLQLSALLPDGLAALDAETAPQIAIPPQ